LDKDELTIFRKNNRPENVEISLLQKRIFLMEPQKTKIQPRSRISPLERPKPTGRTDLPASIFHFNFFYILLGMEKKINN